MRCLITGADGFLGANLCWRLIEGGHEVTGAALNRKGRTSLDALGVDVRLEYGDITDVAYVERLVNAYEPEVIFHLAAVSIVRVAAANKARAIRTNVIGTLNVCEAAERHAHVRKVIVASSDKAYGDAGGAAYTEDMPLRPGGAYEVSKACADHVARLYGATVVRAANLYGPGDLHWSRLVPNSCRRALRGEPPQVYGDSADDRREWLHVEDAVDAYILLAESVWCGAFNVGSGEQASPCEVASIISGIAGGLPYQLADKDRPFYEIPSQALNCERIRSIGWQPRGTLNDGLRHTVDWYRQYLGVPVCMSS